MSRLSLKQAAEFAGTSKPTVLKHIKAGKVSAHKDDEGRWWFDLAELVRAYGEPETRKSSGTGSGNTSANERNRLNLQAELPSETVPKAVADELRARIAELQADKDDLRTRLDAAQAERGELVATIRQQAEQVRLLTDQRQQAGQGKQAAETAAAAKPRRFWARVFGSA